MDRPIPAQFGGACACGAIRYECSAAPLAMVNCHGRDCQRAGGAGYAPTVVVAADAFRVTRGEPRVHRSPADNGATAHRAFCGACGSQLFAWSSARPTLRGIKAGSLDDPGWYRPAVEVWTASAQPWDVMSGATVKFARVPAPAREGAADER